jgi:hypothetical protein
LQHLARFLVISFDEVVTHWLRKYPKESWHVSCSYVFAKNRYRPALIWQLIYIYWTVISQMTLPPSALPENLALDKRSGRTLESFHEHVLRLFNLW